MDRFLAPRLAGNLTVPGASIRDAALSLWRRARLRRLLIALTVALVVLAGGWLWLRDSPLVSVEHVRIAGVRGPQAAAIESALTAAARRMSTLDVNTGALRAAVASYPQVRDVRAHGSFPHSLRITVSEQLPVATLTNGSERTAVAADGVVLGPAFLTSELPVIEGAQPPISGRVTSAEVERYLTVLGAATPSLRSLLARIYTTPKGITAQTRRGMLVYFGDATRARAKWLSFASVVLATGARASYVDVRLPERPAAGVPGEGTAQQPAQSGGLDPSAAALATSLAGAVGAGAGAGAASTASAPAASQGEAKPAGVTTTTEEPTENKP